MLAAARSKLSRAVPHCNSKHKMATPLHREREIESEVERERISGQCKVLTAFDSISAEQAPPPLLTAVAFKAFSHGRN